MQKVPNMRGFNVLVACCLARCKQGFCVLLPEAKYDTSSLYLWPYFTQEKSQLNSCCILVFAVT